MNDRDQHFQAIGFAGAKIAEIESHILAAKLLTDDAIGTVVNAVGDDPVEDSARNAFEWSASLPDRLDEITRICENIKAELNRYGGGF